MKKALKKAVRYLSLVALIVGLVLVAYGAIVNQVAMNTFFNLLNQGGFKAFVIGVLLIVAALVLLVMSFFIGRGKDTRPAPKPAQQPSQNSAQSSQTAADAHPAD